jgi:tetratricopeptide (TPR) repeat protein
MSRTSAALGRALRRALPAVVITVLPAAAAAQETHGAHGSHGAHAPAAAVSGRAPLLKGLGSHHLRITTSSREAQRYFDQGLSLAYAFNHEEARRSFREAARLDPKCAMCEWGAALVLGPNINAPMDPAANAEAYAGARRALALAGGATPRERAYVGALATRYAATPPASRAALDSAYARAMRHVAARFPDDADAATLFAEAQMDLSPWAYWAKDSTPRPGTPQLLGALDRALRLNRNHPGACHYYIHAVEAVYPGRAVACAERLAALMPAAGHLVHMPAHIYLRVGRYGDAIAANEHAVRADERYIADQGAKGFYPIAYYPHNHHFLAFAATLGGRRERAVTAARAAAANTPAAVARDVPDLQLLVAYPQLTFATFGRWDDLLREPLPPADLPLASGLALYARGLAHAARGERAAADAAHDSVKRAAA